MTIERPSSLAPSPAVELGPEPAGVVASTRTARRRLIVALGGLIVLMVFVATRLTFFHPTSSMPSMNMEGTTMGPSVCGVLPVGVVDQALGQLAGAPASTSTKQTTTCRYRLGGTAAGLVVTYEMHVSPQRFNRSVSALGADGSVSPLSALGHEAFGVRRSGTGRTTVRTTVLAWHHGNVLRIETTAPLSAATQLASIAVPQL